MDDTAAALVILFVIFCFVWLIPLIRKKILSLFKGWIGEKKTIFYLWLSLRGSIYHKFHNIILPSKNGTVQIDHLIISVYGLFIVETKNKKGWIFGSENQPVWTQSIYGKNYSFQNPLRQTFRQKRVLSKFLNVDESNIHTIIYFAGNCTFKTPLPENETGGRPVHKKASK